MKTLLVISYFGLAIVCFIAAISMYRYKKGLTTLEENRLSKGVYAWWYYVGVTIPAALMLGPFGNEINLLGIILFLIILGLGWKWKLNQK
jgi:hypothetical protein